jgi:SNF2 family DNA or RNA helicase
MEILLDNQLNAINKLQRFKVGALFMEAGTGKTRTAIELINYTNFDYVLWLTPFQTKENLRLELTKWGLSTVEIQGIESLSLSDKLYLKLIENLKSAKMPFIIVDESLKIKNWDAIRTIRIIELGKLAEYKLILNGTPISRNILDIWAQMQFLSPMILNMNSVEFKNTFCEWKRTIVINGNRVNSKEWIVKFHNVDYLYSLIENYVYECDLKLSLQRQYIEIECDIDNELMSEYNRLKELYLSNEMLIRMNNNIFIEMTTKMQMTYSCSSSKINALNEIIKSNGINKVIVFCKYISSCEFVKQSINEINVLTYGKHSYGLNLQDFNVIVFFDKTWDYAQRIQCERRIWREGQLNNCIYYDLTCKIGLDKIIDQNIKNKTNILEHFKKIGINKIKKSI